MLLQAWLSAAGNFTCFLADCYSTSILQEDDTSCRPVVPGDSEEGEEVLEVLEVLEASSSSHLAAEAGFRAKPAVRRLQRTVNRLEEKFRALNSAIKVRQERESTDHRVCPAVQLRWGRGGAGGTQWTCRTPGA